MTRPSKKPPSNRTGGKKRKSRAADPAARRQAERYSKTRRDHNSEIAEDYVELIAQLMQSLGEARTVDIAARLGVSHVTVTKTIARLQNEGLVSSRPYRSIFLTDDGKRIADDAARRHQLVVQFLLKIGVNAADAEADAEGIEHHVSAATIEALRKFVSGGGA